MMQLGIIGNKQVLASIGLANLLRANEYATNSNRSSLKEIMGEAIYEFIYPPPPFQPIDDTNEDKLTFVLRAFGFPGA